MTRSQALVLAGHGSQHHPGSAGPLFAHADRIRGERVFDEVRTAFWREEPSLRDIATIVESDIAVVVPVLTSEGYFADEVFPRELGIGDSDCGDPDPDGPEVRYAEPVGTHPRMTDVVVERIEATREGPANRAGVVLVGHGTERNERSARSTRDHARRLRERGRYAEVNVAFLDEPPYVGNILKRVSAEEVVVVPVFIADGVHTSKDIPASLGHLGIGKSARLDGRLVHYTGAIGTEPRLADIVVERAVEAGADPDRNPATDRLGTVGTAFHRWLEASDGQLTWGELSIDSEAGEYLVRHHTDANEPAEQLETIEGAIALRDRVRYDDNGRYRPLSGARSLPSGWRLGGVCTGELVRSIRAVYPGSIAHWHRERRDELTTTDLDETVDRQTGFYTDLERLESEEAAAVTESVCGDCVRTRRWRVDGEPAADPDVVGDTIPCDEACPFFLSAAHAFLNSDVSTAKEMDDGVPAGAFEEPANHYRVRFYRALRRRAELGAMTSRATGGR